MIDNPPKSRRRHTAREIVVEQVREAVLTGELPPGMRLNVGDVAKALSVSQTPAREGLQQLAAEGLLRIDPYKGTRVSELSAEECQEIYLMRVGLEGLAARLGAELIDQRGINDMNDTMDRMSESIETYDVDAFIAADRDFHRIHYLASGRTRLWERIISLRYVAERYSRVGFTLPGLRLPDVLLQHQEILHAVSNHDGATAQRIVEDDLRATYHGIFASLTARPSIEVQAS
jgi:DNA-binding GntR family transcriptional regulator